jgi:hypothetical protein
MIAPADGRDDQSLAAGSVPSCGHHPLQAFAAVHLPVDLPAAANFKNENELSPDVGAAAWPIAEGCGGE